MGDACPCRPLSLWGGAGSRDIGLRVASVCNGSGPLNPDYSIALHLVGRRRVEELRFQRRLGPGRDLVKLQQLRVHPGHSSKCIFRGFIHSYIVLGVWGVECTLPVIRTGGPGSGIGAGGLESISELFGYFNQKFSP
eukprot:1176702-Prorocentrum_minimum.AAC.2